MNHRRIHYSHLALITAGILAACRAATVAPITPSTQPQQPAASTLIVRNTPNPFPDPVLKVVGDEQVVFDWSKDQCEALDIPDLPARAFRDADGNVQLIAAHYINRRFIGPSLNSLKHDCKVVMQSPSLQDPS